VQADDLPAEVERLVSLGAARLAGGDPGAVELADPDGNEFSLGASRRGQVLTA